MDRLNIVMEVHRLCDNSPYCFFVHEQAKALVRRGHRVHVISPVMVPPMVKKFRPKWADIVEKTPQQAELDGVSVYYPRGISLGDAGERLMGGYALYRASLPVLERIRRTEPVQLVHAHMIDRDGHCGYLLSRKTGLPYVVTGHGTDVLRYFVPGQTPHRRNIRTVQKADALCAVSSMLMKRVAPYRPDGISRIVPNGVDLSLVPENEKRIPFSILSVGTLKARKCMDKTLEAFSGLAQEFPQAHLTLIGVGEMEGTLRSMIRDLGLEGRAELILGEAHDALLRRMARTDVFVLPSWGEGYGVVYIEAMAAGCIAVGARDEGIGDTIQNGENGFLVKAGSSEETESCLRHILRNRQALEQVRQRGKESAQALTWERNAAEMEILYEEILRMRKKHAGEE